MILFFFDFMEKNFTLRALILGSFLSIIVAMYSAFAGLKVGGVYWPIVTTSLMSLAILTFLGHTSRHEINIAQTAASAGGLLAAGIIFTIPAIWILGLQLSAFEITIIALIGGILGLLFSIPLRKELIEKEKLHFPDGQAAASLIEAGDEKGTKARVLIYSFSAGAFFSFLRDKLAIIPSFFNIDSLKLSISKYFSFGSSISLVPLAGGFLIGLRFTAAWFFGSIITYFFILPFLVFSGFYPDKLSAKFAVSVPLGIGVVIGSAIAYFLIKGLPYIKRLYFDYKHTGKKQLFSFGFIFIFFVGILTFFLNLDPIVSIMAIVGSFIMAYIGGRITGELNVDPMEIFAMIVLISVKLLLGFSPHLLIPLIILSAIVCIAAGIAGDFMQDLKTGFILNTNPRHQAYAQFVGIIFSSLVIGFVIISLANTYGFGNIELPAPQAMAIAQIVKAESLELPLLFGLIIGFIFTVITSFLNLGILSVAFGIGLYVPIELSLPLFVGGIIRYFVDKQNKTDKFRLIAAGMIAGEGLIGVLLSLLSFFSLI